MDSIRSVLTAIERWLIWLPDPVVGALILALAVGVAYSLHRSARQLVRHLLARRFPYLLLVFTQMRGLTQLALLILATTIALPVAPLGDETTGWIARLLLIGIIGLIG